MSDLIERLRTPIWDTSPPNMDEIISDCDHTAGEYWIGHYLASERREAADRIEELEKQVRAMALEKLAEQDGEIL